MENKHYFKFSFVDTYNQPQTTILTLSKDDRELAIATFETKYRFKWIQTLEIQVLPFNLLFEINDLGGKFVWSLTELNNVIDNYDAGLIETLETKKVSEKFNRNHELLGQFAVCNPTFDYCRYLSSERTHHLSYYYSDKMLKSRNSYIE